ncbi:MAG: FG-GAP-like repeat-containing protein [Minisyncoccia bacterium]
MKLNSLVFGFLLVIFVATIGVTTVGSAPVILQGQFGGSGLQSVLGDYDGDGKTDIAVYNRQTGSWRVLTSSDGYQMKELTFGGLGFQPVSGDFDNDGKTDPIIYNQTTGEWQILLSGNNYSLISGGFGGPGYEPIMADYDGDGKTDIAVYNESLGMWYLYLTNEGTTTNPPPLTIACSVTPATANVGEPITWSVSASGGLGSYTYSWSGTDGLIGNSPNVSKTYSSSGQKTATVTVTSGSQTISASCSTTVVALPTEVVVTNNSSYVLVCVVNDVQKSIGLGQQKSWDFNGSFEISISTDGGYSWSQEWTMTTSYYYSVTNDVAVPGTLSIYGHQ